MARRVGLRFEENMYGSFEPLAAELEPGSFVFHMKARSESLLRTVLNGRVETSGWVEAEGLASRSELTGFMVMRPLLSRFIQYDFGFVGDDGKRYRYSGTKTIRHLHPRESWTTLVGSIYDSDEREIATSVVRFDLSELRSFLAGFRPTLAPSVPPVAGR